MQLRTFLDGVSANGDSSTETFDLSGIRGLYGVFQAEISGTATVTLYGRLSSDYSWKQIVQYTASDAEEVVMFPDMKATVSGYSSGTIDAAIMGGG